MSEMIGREGKSEEYIRREGSDSMIRREREVLKRCNPRNLSIHCDEKECVFYDGSYPIQHIYKNQSEDSYRLAQWHYLSLRECRTKVLISRTVSIHIPNAQDH
jgi:hypothetical protein